MEILLVLAKEVVEDDVRIEDVIMKIKDVKIDLHSAKDELMNLEQMNLLDDEEADAIKSILVYIFMKNTEMEPDEIYSLVFGRGKRILWN
jgi:hypothetical protein